MCRKNLKKLSFVVLFIIAGRISLSWIINRVNVKPFQTVTGRTLRQEYNAPGKSVSNTEARCVTLYHRNDTDLSGFSVGKAKLEFLPEFKNPCWLEPYSGDAVYKKNYFFTKYYGKKISHSKLSELPQKGVTYENAELCGDTGRCRLRCLPYFMLLGVHKSGSTDIYKRIDLHPRIFSSINKEVYWWNQLRYSKMLGASLGDYVDLFDGATSKLQDYTTEHQASKGQTYYPSVIGEYTAMTFFDMSYWRSHPKNRGLAEPAVTTPDDIYQLNPNTKLMVILRNPVTRLYSHYNFFTKEVSPEDFHQRVLGSIWWWKKCTETKKLPRRNCAYGSPPEMPPVYDELGKPPMWWNKQYNYSGEIRTSMYAIHAKEWLRVFPRSSMLFIKMEEYSKDIAKTYADIFLFLGIDLPGEETMGRVTAKRASLRNSYRPMLDETRGILDEFYRPFNEELAELLGDKKWLWTS